MTSRFMFTFGYCTPKQLANNRQHGWDDEDSEALYVLAENADQALRWGCEIAEAFMKTLFKDPSISWREMQFAATLAPAYDVSMDLPVVQVGEYPDLKKIIARKYGDG